MATNMKAPLCARTLRNAHKTYPGIEGAICHSDYGVQYTSDCYRRAVRDCHITQSMNSDGGRCHDNARCESMWARMKSELRNVPGPFSFATDAERSYRDGSHKTHCPSCQ